MDVLWPPSLKSRDGEEQRRPQGDCLLAAGHMWTLWFREVLACSSTELRNKPAWVATAPEAAAPDWAWPPSSYPCWSLNLWSGPRLGALEDHGLLYGAGEVPAQDLKSGGVIKAVRRHHPPGRVTTTPPPVKNLFLTKYFSCWESLETCILKSRFPLCFLTSGIDFFPDG